MINIHVLHVGFIKSLLCVKFCNKDDPKRSLEEQAYMFFVDFLDDCEGEYKP